MKTIEEVFLAARLERPYFSVALAALTPVAKPGLGTFAVDKFWRFYYDPEFLEKSPLKTLSGLLADHELQHLLRDHASRAQRISAEPTRWNVAGDAEINDDIDIKILPDFCVTPKKIGMENGLLAEEYYFNSHMGNVSTCSGGSGAGRPLPSELPPDKNSITKADAEKIRKKTAEDIVEEAKNKGAGSVSADLLAWAETMLPAPKKISLFEKLKNLAGHSAKISRNSRSDFSWKKRSRRSTEKIILPGVVGKKIRAAVVVDTSGSMGSAGEKVMRSLSTVLATGFETKIIACDVDVKKVRRHGFKKIEFFGGGGTDLRPAIALAEKRSDIIFIISDGATPWPSSPPKRKTVLILTSGKKNNWHGCAEVQL